MTTVGVDVVDIWADEPPAEEAHFMFPEIPGETWSCRFSDVDSAFLTAGQRLHIATIQGSGERYITYILEFNPQTARLNVLSRKETLGARLPGAKCGDTLSDNHFAWFDPAARTIHIWDFCRDLTVFWTWQETGFFQLHDRQTIFLQMFIDRPRNQLMLHTISYVYVWKLDTVLPHHRGGEIPFPRPLWTMQFDVREPMGPYCRFPFAVTTPIFISFFSLDNYYHNHHVLPGLELLQTDLDASAGLFYIYEFKFPPSPVVGNRNSIGWLFPLNQVHLVGGQGALGRRSIHHNCLCDGQQVVLWEDGGLYVLIKSRRLANEPSSSPVRKSRSIPLHGMTRGFSASETFPPIRRDISGVEVVRHSGSHKEEYYVHGDGSGPDGGGAECKAPFGAVSFDPVSGIMCSTTGDGKQIVVQDYLGAFGG